MRPGGKRVIRCPPHKHWGSIGYGEGKGRIPPHTTLTLHIDLKSIE
jgi:FKBP-type peptidyl-prolyl cis-trans isomerase